MVREAFDTCINLTTTIEHWHQINHLQCNCMNMSNFHHLNKEVGFKMEGPQGWKMKCVRAMIKTAGEK